MLEEEVDTRRGPHCIANLLHGTTALSMLFVSSRVITFRRQTPSWQVLACATSTISHVLPACLPATRPHRPRCFPPITVEVPWPMIRTLQCNLQPLATCETELGPYRLLLVSDVGAIVSVSNVRHSLATMYHRVQSFLSVRLPC